MFRRPPVRGRRWAGGTWGLALPGLRMPALAVREQRPGARYPAGPHGAGVTLVTEDPEDFVTYEEFLR